MQVGIVGVPVDAELLRESNCIISGAAGGYHRARPADIVIRCRDERKAQMQLEAVYYERTFKPQCEKKRTF